MILPDVNILVHAFRTDSPDHDLCHSWLEDVVNGDSRYGMSPQVLSGVIRVVTHPKAALEDRPRVLPVKGKRNALADVKRSRRLWDGTSSRNAASADSSDRTNL